MDQAELNRLAQEELLQEAKRGKARAEQMGPMGWQRCPLPTTNKRFLHNVVVSTLEPKKKKLIHKDQEHRRPIGRTEDRQEKNRQHDHDSIYDKRASKHKDKCKGKGTSLKHESSQKFKHKKSP